MTKIWVLWEGELGGNMKVATVHSTMKGAKKKQHGFLNFMCTYISEYEVMD
jgi:hypothetical protein